MSSNGDTTSSAGTFSHGLSLLQDDEGHKQATGDLADSLTAKLSTEDSSYEHDDEELEQDQPNQTLFKTVEVMDHARASSHGTYLQPFGEELEDLEYYQKGGYHPIHLGDILDIDGRYRVIYKLGYGGYGTVWLCRDTQLGKYVAVKVSIAGANTASMIDLVLEKLDNTVPGAEYIARINHHFSLEGPNGTHQCLVLPLLGPRISPGLWINMDDHDYKLKAMCHQAIQAMEYLHRNNICHGDFRPGNILVKLVNLDHLAEDELLSLLGPPKKHEVRTETGKPVPVSTPEYLVAPIDLSRLDAKYLTDEICVVDFGESFLTSSPPKDLGIPLPYLPPELLLEYGAAKDVTAKDTTVIGIPSDLWALGCTLFDICQQMPLFYMLADKDEQLAEMVGLLGKMPDQLWNNWKGRVNYYGDDGNRIVGEEAEPMEQFLNHKMEVLEENDETKVLLLPEAERVLFADLLRKILRYEPGERLSAREALEHEWFRT